MAFGLTPYGRREIALATGAAMMLCALTVLIGWRVSWWLLTVAAVPLAAWLWVLWFFRDPDRQAPAGEGLFVSPADGRVADITPIGPDSPLGCDGVRIGIFMDIFNVHVNRCPQACLVREISHRDGVFLDVRHPDAPMRNESATIVFGATMGGREYQFVVRQIAGLIARRIVTDLTVGERLGRGQRIGMIKFGSRLELMVPTELAGEVRVRVGDRVRAGQTVLAAAAKETEDDSTPADR